MPKYVIGVSQCSEDSWRKQLHDEMEISAYFYDNVTLRYTCANDDYRCQMRQIDSLVDSGIDLLIASPQQLHSISPSIDRAFDKGIPVILFDRKTGSDKYSTFMGADNEFIGELLADYLVNRLPDGAVIVEVEGQKNSSPAVERKCGFDRVVKRHGGMKIISLPNDDWTEASGARAMEKFIKGYKGRIDCVFGGNDRIAMGAKKVLRKYNIDCSGILFAGIDALHCEGGGMQLVRDGELDVSVPYPTQGDALLELAVNMLTGKKYERENMMNTSLVTKENAKVLLMQSETFLMRAANIRKLSTKVEEFITMIEMQRMWLYTLLLLIVVVVTFVTYIIHAYRVKKDLSLRLLHEKEIVERQRDELEYQRDKLIEANAYSDGGDEHNKSEALSAQTDEKEKGEDSRFLVKFKEVLDARFSDSELCVEDLASEMNLSRVQLYRKVKSLTGISPVEYIKRARLSRAHSMLSDTSLTVSEIAYSIGFSSPGYFTKCYKEQYGVIPTNRRK